MIFRVNLYVYIWMPRFLACPGFTVTEVFIFRHHRPRNDKVDLKERVKFILYIPLNTLLNGLRRSVNWLYRILLRKGRSNVHVYTYKNLLHLLPEKLYETHAHTTSDSSKRMNLRAPWENISICRAQKREGIIIYGGLPSD